MTRECLVGVGAIARIRHNDLVELEALGKLDVEQQHAVLGHGLLAGTRDDGQIFEQLLELGQAACIGGDDGGQAPGFERLLDCRLELHLIVEVIGAFDDDRLDACRLDGLDAHALLVIEQAREQGRNLR